MDKFVVRLPKSTKTVIQPNCANSSEYLPNASSTTTPKVCSGRKFQKHWENIFPWIYYDSVLEKVFCNVCKEAENSNFVPPSFTTSDKDSIKSFVNIGYSQWNKALERFKTHEKSSFHRLATVANVSKQKGMNVSALLSENKLKEMKNARKALMAIISSLKYLAQQGLAIRGHSDKSSNIYQLLLLRANDVEELKTWLQRTNYRWLSHDILSEMVSLLAKDVLNTIINSLKEAQFFSIITDETTDISTKEQVSICFRFVNKNLQIEEVFVGFYKTDSTTSETLLKIVLDVLQRFEIDIKNCRGQCYDGASNVSGHITGLQAKIRDLEQKAIFVHCAAHNLNLVVQDAIQNVYSARDFLTIFREIIAFVRNSPKRLSVFQSVQNDAEELDVKENGPRPSLRPFCPTRSCVRIKSMKTLESNYDVLLVFLEKMSEEKSEAGAKASGLLTAIQSFKFFFLLKALISIFYRVETLNAILQSKNLKYSDVKHLVENLLDTLFSQRNKFDDLWAETLRKAEKLDIEEPALPRSRKKPRRYDDGSDPHVFETAEKMFRQTYFEIIDKTANSLKTRFEKNAMELISELEAFSLNNADAEKITKLYGSDFDKDKLILHRAMFFDICKAKSETVTSLQDIVNILSMESNSHLRDLLPEFVKFITLTLTIPVTSCTSERSFSTLRRLKTFLRSTMTQKKLNDLAILHTYKDIDVNLNKIANVFVNANEIRRKTFYIEQ